MKFFVEGIKSIAGINTNRHYEFTPFVCVGDLVYVKKEWWRRLDRKQRDDIIDEFGEEYGYAIRDSIDEYDRSDCEESEAFWKFYNAYINSYALNRWNRYIQTEYYIHALGEETVKSLLELSKKSIRKYKTVSDEEAKSVDRELYDSINKFIKRFEKIGVFMKLTDSSGKRVNPVKPKFSVKEVIEDIVNNRDLVNSLVRMGENSFLLLKPWNNKISRDTEYRVIVHNRHVSAISQQKCYSYAGLNSTIARKAGEIIVKGVEELGRLPYNSCVLDMWVEDGKAYLIEINPGEMWSTSGSSLFNWVEDREKIEQNENTFIRYIKYDKVGGEEECLDIDISTLDEDE